MSPDMLTSKEWKADAMGPLTISILTLIALLFLLHHFKDHRGLSNEVKLFAVLSHAFLVIECCLHSVISTNALFSNMMGFRQYFDVMTPYKCSNLIISQLLMHLITRYCMISFSISKLRHFFVSSSLKLDIKIYYGWLLSFAVLILVIFLYLMSNISDGWVMSAIDEQNIKRCTVSKNDEKIVFVGLATYIFTVEVVMQSALLYLYYRKWCQFRRIYSETNIDDKYVKKHVVWRSMILGIIAIISLWITALLMIIFQTHSLITSISVVIMLIIQILSIILSFDVCQGCNNNNNNRRNEIPRQNEENGRIEIELTSDQDDYLSRIMEAYYRAPTRINGTLTKHSRSRPITCNTIHLSA